MDPMNLGLVTVTIDDGADGDAGGDGDGDRAVIHLAGELDLSGAEALRRLIDRSFPSDGAGGVVFDLAALEFMDSSGIALLLSVAQRHGPVQLLHPSPMVRRIIEATGLAEVLEMTGAGATAAFAGEPESVAAARRFVATAVVGIGDDLRDRMVVMVSELATNAILHGATGYTVHVEHSARCVRVTVADGGGGQPSVRRPAAEELHGRGLQIVRDLSDAWGVTSEPGTAGKQVWAEVRLPS
jgi:anti-anti-sigma factor